MTAQKPAYLTLKQVTERYSIGSSTLYRWMDDEEISFPKSVSFGRRCVRWKVSDLEAWEESRGAS